MSTVKYHVPAISCKHCVMTITRELSDLEGVSSASGEVDTKDVSVTFGPPATEEKIKNLMLEIGYPVEV
jgi:copper chaperone